MVVKQSPIKEVTQVIINLQPKKTPKPNRITNEIIKLVFIPKTMTAIYKACLRTGRFPTNWKIAKIHLIVKPGREKSADTSEYRSISLLNSEGKVMEKLLSKRITHHLYTTQYLNENQYGCTPQNNMVDAAMEVKQYIEPHLERGRVAIIVSLDVQGAFDSAWWPAIIQSLRDAKCPKNLYYLVQHYLKNREVFTAINSYNTRKNIRRDCAQVSCCGTTLWNIQYDKVLNLKFTDHTRVVAFADDLILMIRRDNTSVYTRINLWLQC
jgi:hypothetical protein